MKTDFHQKLIIAYAWSVLPLDWKEAAVGLFQTSADENSEWTLVLIAMTDTGVVQDIFPKHCRNVRDLHIHSQISNEMFELQAAETMNKQIVFRFSRDEVICDVSCESAAVRSPEFIQAWKRTAFNYRGGTQDA